MITIFDLRELCTERKEAGAKTIELSLGEYQKIKKNASICEDICKLHDKYTKAYTEIHSLNLKLANEYRVSHFSSKKLKLFTKGLLTEQKIKEDLADIEKDLKVTLNAYETLKGNNIVIDINGIKMSIENIDL